MSKYLVLTGLILLLLLGVFGCPKKEEAPQSQGTTQETKVEMVNDPVCGMKINKTNAIMHEHEGKTYYFCEAQCKDEFQKDPGKYISGH